MIMDSKMKDVPNLNRPITIRAKYSSFCQVVQPLFETIYIRCIKE